MNLGIIIILITALGYISNQLNGRWLNFKITRWLYYLGAVVHETSHALACILTGAKVTEFKIFTRQPRVVHTKSRLPILGQIIISLAPLAGGLLFLYLINRYTLSGHFIIPALNNLNDLITAGLGILSQIDLLTWQSWLMILLFLNVGAMIGPSTQDLKNIWPALIIMFFISWSILNNLGLLIICLILINIVIQIIIILINKFFKVVSH